MPANRTINWGDYNISVRHAGFRGWRLFRWIPYLSGSDVKIVIKIKTKSKQRRKFIYKWLIQRYDGSKENTIWGLVSRSHILEPRNEVVEEWSKYLVTYGQHNLQLQLDDKDDGGNTGLEVMSVFSIFEGDKIVPYVVFSLVSLATGSGLTLLIQWIVS